MASHSADILEELEDLFAWSPAAHIFVRPHEADQLGYDNSSRDAVFYDLHLASDRICKRVVPVKNLHKKIAHVVDATLQEIRDRAISFQPPTAPEFVSRALRDAKLRPVTVGRSMANRLAITEYYLTKTFKFCGAVASALALHPKWWSALINWSLTPRHDRLGSRAPSLHLVPMDAIIKEEFVPEHFSLEMFKRLKKIRASSNDLATWEIRGLTIDDTDAMLGIMTMASASGENQFQWQTCSGTPCAPVDDSIPKMSSRLQMHGSSKILSLVEEPWIDTEPVAHEGVSGIPDSPASILDDSLKRSGSSMQSVREDIYRKQLVLDPDWESETESEVAERATSRLREVEEMDWTPPAAGHVPSQELIQMAWGQSVRQNSTVLIIHAGNYEYICIRHRETQTLYISDILHIPFLKDPGYGKVQIGIYITALDDALQRIVLDETGGTPGTPAGVAGSSPAKEQVPGASEDGHIAQVPKATTNKRSRKSSRGRSKKRQRTLGIEWTLAQAFTRPFLLLHLHYDIYDTVNPEIFHRIPFVDSEEGDNTPEPVPLVTVVPKDERLLLFLNSELGQGATGVVHGGVVQVESDHESSRLNIAAKLSFTDDQRERLQQEWVVYMRLMMEDAEGITPALGIFYDPELDDKSPLVLLMPHAGVSLQRSGISITPTQRDAFLAGLRSIHKAGVYHGDLRYENLVIDSSGDVAIIDFDQAIIDGKESDKKSEYRKLRRLLEARVDTSIRDEPEPEGSRGPRTRKERNRDEGAIVGRVTRSMGTARETLGGMRLRPRR